MRAQFVLSEIWIGLRRNLTMTIAVITTVAISLALFGAGMLINQQVSAMRGYWDQRISITIYLCTELASTHCVENVATDEDRNSIQADLEACRVADVECVDQARRGRTSGRFANSGPRRGHQGRRHPRQLPGQLVDPQYEKVRRVSEPGRRRHGLQRQGRAH